MPLRVLIKTWADRAALASLALLTITGLLVHNASSLSGNGVRWHFASAIAALLALAPNLPLEWPALVSFVRRRPATGSLKRAVAGLIAVAALVALPFMGPETMVAPTPEPPAGFLREDAANRAFDKLTLREIEERMRVPAPVMRKALKLPADTPADTPLSFLMPKHGFTWEDVQDAIFGYHRGGPPPRGR